MKKENRAVIGVDLGGTKIATGMLDQDGGLLARSQKATAGLQSSKEVISTIVDTIEEVRGQHEIAGVGVASPGMVDSKNGVILNGVNLPDWDGISLQSELEKRLGISVRLINDANAAAWGEYVYGAGRGSQSMVYVTLSTGIGSGLVLDGRLFLGTSSFAGELGHTVIDPGGALCGCGQRGCWETYASGTAIARIANEAIAESAAASQMTTLAAAEGVPVSAKHVFQAAGMGDELANATLEQVIHYTGLGLANIIHSFNPDCIVIGGGVSRAGAAFFEPLLKKTEELVMEPYRGTCKIKPAELKDDVGIIGAAALFVDHQ
ncbi:ROK family protein [Paenibacillus sp. HJL G12]|uniref:ROK family protein n=1 Tax=Paenibacillus dendrobii TaxID=2691084 RepID=A0A7X3LI06_9BACL|nr:ROK family protein [Paenibacillus dendrobii]MWV44093.1 ROK family protein [Paenibacillus dendrobii]